MTINNANMEYCIVFDYNLWDFKKEHKGERICALVSDTTMAHLKTSPNFILDNKDDKIIYYWRGDCELILDNRNSDGTFKFVTKEGEEYDN